MEKNKCVFLDRDGVINKDRVDYVYKEEDLHILDGVKKALETLKKNGYMLVVITNQSGIDKGIFTEQEVEAVHQSIQRQTGHCIDAFYFSPYHRTKTSSLGTKPGSLMFEKAIAKYNIDTKQSWMVGDRLRDLVPAEKLGMKTVLLESEYGEKHDGFMSNSLYEAVKSFILN